VLRFEDIVGHDAVVAQLQAALANDRVSQAYLFAGPQGVGKMTTALAFAQRLINPAGDPEQRRLLEEEAHPDLHVVTKELAAFSEDASLRSRKQRNIPIDLLRERMLGGEVGAKRVDPLVALAPSLGARRVFLLDEAELLAREGANALLKTLEEPPPAAVIVLISAREQRVLPTIRSRCQRVLFRPLDDAAMQRWAALPSSPLAALNEEDAAWILRFAAGSPGLADLAARTELLRWRDALEPLLERAEAGRAAPALGSTMASLVDEWAAAWVKAHAGASKEAANQRAAALLLRLLSQRARRSLAAPEAQARQRAAAMARVGALAKAEAWLAASVSPKLVFAWLAGAWRCAEQAPTEALFQPPAAALA